MSSPTLLRELLLVSVGVQLILSVWNKEVIGNIPKKIQERRKRLNALTTQDQDGSHGAEINQIRKELNDLLDSEEMLWH